VSSGGDYSLDLLDRKLFVRKWHVQKWHAQKPHVAQSHKSSQNGTNRGSRASSSSVANRQPSGSSNKKRKHDPALSTKTNGVRPTSGSSRAKKRKAFREDDQDADPDYNEDIPEPGVSTDEE
jgi:hypothetical protein